MDPLESGNADTPERLFESARARLLEALGTRAREVHSAARARWPVRTGRSRDGLQVEVKLTRGGLSVEAVIRTVVEYTPRIRVHHAYRPWDALVRAPLLGSAAAIRREFKRAGAAARIRTREVSR